MDSPQTNLQSLSASSQFTQQWLHLKFSEYYSHARPTLPEIQKREFGFGGWDKKIEFRHIQFANSEELWSRLRKDAPLYVSASAAYYEFADARPMARKNWLGADLIFDLDAEPDSLSPFILPSTLEQIRAKTISLIEDYLIPDFGISKSEMQVNFSGSRGYHVRVYKKEAFSLGRQERRELVDYIEGIGLDFNDFFHEVPVEESKFTKLEGPSPSMGGHKGRFARKVVQMMADAKTAVQISPKLKKAEEAAKFVKGIEAGRWSDVRIGFAIDKFRDIFEKNKMSISQKIETDANVTIDTSKILRLPDSLHGGSGLIAKTVPSLSSLSSFSPLSDALAFSKTKTCKIKAGMDIASQEFAGQTFDAIKNGEQAELPECYAVYLVCKRAAIPV